MLRSVREVIREAWVRPYSTKSDYARAHASEVAMAACEGLITTRLTGDAYSNIWRITPAGIQILWSGWYPASNRLVDDYEEE